MTLLLSENPIVLVIQYVKKLSIGFTCTECVCVCVCVHNESKYYYNNYCYQKQDIQEKQYPYDCFEVSSIQYSRLTS